MLELVLALQLLGAPAPAPHAHVVPTLSLGQERAPLLAVAAGAAPDVAAADLGAVPPDAARAALPRPVRAGTVAASALGIVVADVVAGIPLLLGFLQCLDEALSFGESGSCRSGLALIYVGAATFVALPPAAAVLGARAAGERGDAAWSAYGLGLLVRLGALGLAASLPGGGLAVMAASELLLAPYVVARVLAGAPPIEQAHARAPAPTLAALEVRDPGGWRAGTGR